MISLKRLLGDAILVGVLFSLLFLPFGAVGLTHVKTSEVLSETTVYQEPVTAPKELYNREYYRYDDSILESTTGPELDLDGQW